jgi:TadE-like protein
VWWRERKLLQHKWYVHTSPLERDASYELIAMASTRRKIRAMTARKHELGQAPVEFAFSVVFVIILIAGFIELFVLLYAYVSVGDAAKEGVRCAIVHGTLSNNCNGPGDPLKVSISCKGSYPDVINAITNYANASGQRIASGDITITYTNPAGGSACSAPGCGVQVTIAHTYRPFFGFAWPSARMHAAAKGTVTF